MVNYRSIFMSFLDQKGVHYVQSANGVISITFNGGENCDLVEVLVGFDNDGDNLVRILSFSIGSFSNESFGKALVLCNSLNLQYRWVKFYIDDEYRIVASSDAIVDEETCGDECFEYVVRMMKIIDDVYPQFMRARWA